MRITSVQNPGVKAVVALHQRKARESEGLILVEGQHPVEEALKAGLSLKALYVREGGTLPAGVSVEAIEVTDGVMAKMATTDTPPPLLGVFGKPQHTTETLFAAAHALVVGVVELQDPGNLGTLIRSACAFGATGLVTVGPHVDPYHPKVVRASAGLLFRLPIAHVDSVSALAAQVQQHAGLQVRGTSPHGGASYREMAWTDTTLLLLGSEAHGLPEAAWAFAEPVQIPMASGVESLNVAMAGAIILAEAYQQRQRLTG